MDKIASPQDLQAELQSLRAFVHASEKPDRQVIAAKLHDLADRVAGVKKEKIPESERDSWKDSVKRNRGKYHGPNGLKSGQKYEYQGKDWWILDFDAESKAPGGATLILVSSDFTETVRGVEVTGIVKAALGLADRVALVQTPREMEQMFEETLMALNQIEASAEDFGFSPKGAAESRKIMLQSYREWGDAKRTLSRP